MTIIFTLYTMVQQHLLRNKKLYVALLIFEKAFTKKNMASSLEKKHSGEMHRALKSLSKIVKNRVCSKAHLYVHSKTSCIRYWLRTTRLDPSRHSWKVCNMLVGHHNRGKACWVSEVCATLCLYGLSGVWENQGVRNDSKFVYVFKQ